MSKEVLDILSRISLERNIPLITLHEALESALISASKKMLPPDVEVVEAEFDRETGEFRIYANMEVVEEVEDEHTEISLEEAREYVGDVSVGEMLVIDVTPENFGRIAAQSAKQVITQRIREAEREIVYDKYKNRAGDLVAGTVQRYEKGNVVVDLGNAEAVLPSREQPQGERYRFGDRLKAVIKEIKKSSKDAQIILSRTTPQLVAKLFEQEVAEIKDGVVSIRLIAREPGKRTKIAVLSSDSDVDPVGACVGMKGSRVQMVVQELRGERIDIIEYSDDKRRFVANSLKPANIESVELNELTRRALLVVADDELALAIGKNGLNAKLASQLTGCEIDIITESQLNARELQAKQELGKLPTLLNDARLVDALLSRGIISRRDVIHAGADGLAQIEGVGDEAAQAIYGEALESLGEKAPVIAAQDEEEDEEDAPETSGEQQETEDATDEESSSQSDDDDAAAEADGAVESTEEAVDEPSEDDQPETAGEDEPAEPAEPENEKTEAV
ncbi:MAG: transcription termination/antitermination protein NusA [bacterium]|nr:transcription termination/antitermination protein NusA [bacterium]